MDSKTSSPVIPLEGSCSPLPCCWALPQLWKDRSFSGPPTLKRVLIVSIIMYHMFSPAISLYSLIFLWLFLHQGRSFPPLLLTSKSIDVKRPLSLWVGRPRTTQILYVLLYNGSLSLIFSLFDPPPPPPSNLKKRKYLFYITRYAYCNGHGHISNRNEIRLSDLEGFGTRDKSFWISDFRVNKTCQKCNCIGTITTVITIICNDHTHYSH